MKMNETSQEKTTFTMYVGCKSSGSCPLALAVHQQPFNTHGESAGRSGEDSASYIDNVLMIGTFYEHRKTSERHLNDYTRLWCDWSPQCHLVQWIMEYLDYIMSNTCILADPKKVEAVKSLAKVVHLSSL